MQHNPNESTRDRTRRTSAKYRAMTRKGQRRAKSAMLFLAFAFPAEFAL